MDSSNIAHVFREMGDFANLILNHPNLARCIPGVRENHVL